MNGHSVYRNYYGSVGGARSISCDVHNHKLSSNPFMLNNFKDVGCV